MRVACRITNLAALLILLCLSAPAKLQAESYASSGFDEVLDLHGDPAHADLVIFMAGNQFMLADALIRIFSETHPDVHRIFYETLPPGVLAAQTRDGVLRMGNLVISVIPDVFLSGHRRMHEMAIQRLVSQPFAYATNHLAIMVRKGNPKRIYSLRDLGRSDVRVSMPNPKTEGVALEIEQAYRRAGGSVLVHTIMVTKVHNGTTVLTTIHHRETPFNILAFKSDAGPVWATEAMYQERVGAPVSMVAISTRYNVTAVYEAATVTKTSHPKAAREFLQFLRSSRAKTLYRSYGFGVINYGRR